MVANCIGKSLSADELDCALIVFKDGAWTYKRFSNGGHKGLKKSTLEGGPMKRGKFSTAGMKCSDRLLFTSPRN
jgi:hypothetical protein